MSFEPIVGRKISRLAALAMAVSPGFVFYGRYSIHEVWLLLFSMLFILGLARPLENRDLSNYLWCAGMGVFGMILTKETYIIHVGCAADRGRGDLDLASYRPAREAKPARQTWTYLDLAVVIVVGLATLVFFYSGHLL